MADWHLFGTGDCGDAGKGGQKGGDHACQEAQGEMQNKSKLTSSFQKALNQGQISNVLQESIRARVVGAMPHEQRQVYDDEEKRYGADAATRGPAHIAVNRSIDRAEGMILHQAISHTGVGQIQQNVEMAARLIQNPQTATPQEWAKLGITTGLTVGTHGMMPPEISDKLSRTLTDQSTTFFTGTGRGTFADLQVNLQAEMVSLQPTLHKISVTADQAGQEGKKAVLGVSKWFKGNVIDPAAKKLKPGDNQE